MAADFGDGTTRQRRLLESLDFNELNRSHFFDQLKKCFAGDLANLYELHARENSTAYQQEESPVSWANLLL